MPRSADIAAQLPYLRRYARALLGAQSAGDGLVEATLTDIIGNPAQMDQAASLRMALFAALHRVHDKCAAANDDLLQTAIVALPAEQRQLLLLTSLEDFSIADAAAIINVDAARAEIILAEALHRLDSDLQTSVLIIEDEPMIALDLEHLVEDLGHRVTALAATRSEAVAAVAIDRPGLVLADIQLADGSSGIDAVADIQSAIDVPVIFITAFPERLLTGERVEPTFLITKPFRPAAVRATIAQALMFEPISA